MCGFVGFLGPIVDENMLKRASENIFHRGPDANGIYFDANNKIGLAHQRLSIVELSSLGAQPMTSASDRYVIAFNGEIYNHLDIRKNNINLKSHMWRGSSDTETLLELIEAQGLDLALKEITGMFAFALWDKKNKRITLVRDRMGEKPLYYGWQNGCFIFGSEPKALFKLIKNKPSIDANAVNLYFHHGYIPAPLTVWENIKKLKPGKYISLQFSDKEKWPIEESFWNLDQIILDGMINQFDGDENEAMSVIEDLLRESVSIQSMADVELGAFLSGGIDSSLVTALMQKNSNSKIKTFSIGFNETDFNEAHYARQVSNILGTEHHELLVESPDIQDLLPSLPNIFDEPFADTSMFPTYLVAKLASEKVKVCLSGDAADELFCGYDRYFNNWSYDLWNKINRNSLIGTSLKTMTLPLVSLFNPNYRAKFSRFHSLVDCKTSSDYFRWLHGNSSPVLINDFNSQECEIFNDNFFNFFKDNESRFMAYDCSVWLADDILCKVDRASMAVSLECRVPFLDHRIVEFAWKLPIDMKRKDRTGKTILRRLLYNYVPEEIVNRPKQGFSMPIKHWLKGDLKEWAGDMIFDKSISSYKNLDSSIIKARWKEHQQGKYDWSETIWKTALFSSWINNYKSDE